MHRTISIQCSAADVLPLDAIVEFQGGLKKRTKKEINLMITSLEKYGFSFPFMVWRNGGQNLCLDGHGRIQALAEMRRRGYDLPLFPVVYVEAKDEEEAKNKLLRLNSQYGQMTIDSVLEFTEGIEVEFDELMLHGDTLKMKPPGEETEGDDELPEEVEAVTKPGDLWELGEHRLLCGDSTKEAEVALLMDGQKADMVFTDPPYGVDYSGGMQFRADGSVVTNARKKLDNDHDASIYTNSIPLMAQFCSGPIYTWFAGTKAKELYEAIEDQGMIHALIIWVKKGGYGALNANYKQKHEPCLYWKSKKGVLNFCGASTETTIWNIDKDLNNKLHPTQKPIALAEKAILNHSVGSILDLFGGSGSTLIACEKLNRKARLMELDPHYCDVIIFRYIRWMNENGRSFILKKNGEEVDPKEILNQGAVYKEMQ